MRQSRLFIGVSTVLILATGPPSSGGRLFPHPALETSISPFGVLSSDFDDDGHLDLAVACRNGSQVEVFRGVGDGTFAPATPYAVNGFPGHMALGDFNEDGHEDLAVSNRYDNPISVFLSNGDGTFGPEAQFGQVDDRAGIAVGDFNEDDRLDLISVAPNTAYLLFGAGDGTFDGEVVLPGDWVSVAVDDFNGDELDDYAYGHWTDADLVEVQLGNGDGTFSSAGTFAVGEAPFGIAAGDISGDQIPDLVVTNSSSHDLSVLIGNGDGSFAPEVRYSLGSTYSYPTPVFAAISDLDEDGLQDLAISNYWGARPSASLFYGTGGGLFAPAVWGDESTGFAYTMSIDDFDGDGAEDLVRVQYGAGEVNLLFGDGEGKFVTVNHEEVGEEPQSVTVADLNGDGRLDLVTPNLLTDDVSVLLADGAGSFAPEIRYCVDSSILPPPPCVEGNGPSSVAVAELTGDAHLDLAVANRDSATVSILEGDGAGGFAAPSVLGTGFTFLNGGIVAGELNGDVATDLVVAGSLSDAIQVFLGNGDGTFVAQPTLGVGVMPVSMTSGDLDGDPHLDLVVTNEGSNDLNVLLGVGDGTFVAAPTLAGGTEPTDTAIGDLNGDSIPDLAVVNRFSSDVFLFPGNGDGTFGSATVSTGRNGTSITIADLDGDGRPDLATAGTSRVGVLPGNGDGSFGEVQLYHTGFSHEGVIAAHDFNLDSLLDVVTSADDHNKASVLLNQSGPAALTILPDHTTLVWPAVTGAESYDVYRGEMSSLADEDDDGLPDGGYGDCLTGLDSDPRDTFFVDADLPPSGDGFFYLLSVVDSGGVGGIGQTSAGLPRVPELPCP